MGPSRSSGYWAAAALVLLLVLAAALRFGSLGFDYGHPDEVISVEVAKRVAATGSLDTNWRLATTLPAVYRYPQYNFSGYLLAAAGLLAVERWFVPGTDPLLWLRTCSAFLGTLVILLTYLAGRRLFGTAAALCAAVLVAVNPLLYQDGLYARPETFVTALALLVVFLAAAPGPATAPRARASRIAAAFLYGVLLASKVSMLLLAPLLLLAVTGRADTPPDPPRHPAAAWLSHVWGSGKWLALAAVAGFAAGAPYALVHPGDYLSGIKTLQTQYGVGHWPYGSPEGDIIERLGYSADYFHATTGWLIPAALAGGVVALRRREYRALIVLLVAVLTLLRFSTYPAFFERNVSHVVPFFALFAGYALAALVEAASRSRAVRPAALVLVLGLVALPSASTTARLRWQELPGTPKKLLEAKRAALERELNIRATPLEWVASVTGMRHAIGDRCDGPILVEMRFAGEDKSEQFSRQLQAEAFHVVARMDATFSDVPTSSLQTYFTPGTLFLYRPATTAGCRVVGWGFVTAASVGAPLPVLALDMEGGWTRGGAYEDRPPPFSREEVLGSWSGSDAKMGRMRMTVDVKGAGMLVLPILSGPVATHQSFEIRDAATGKVLDHPRPGASPEWRFMAVRIPPGIATIHIEARDAGSGWGEWQAIGLPRTLKAY